MMIDVRLSDLCHGNIMGCNGMYCSVLVCNECMNICMHIHTYTKYVYNIWVYMGIHVSLCTQKYNTLGKVMQPRICVIYIYVCGNMHYTYISYIYSQIAVMHK